MTDIYEIPPEEPVFNWRKVWLEVTSLTCDLEQAEDERDELREMLHDVEQLRLEYAATGGGPRFHEREAAAWNRVHEYFQP